MFSPVSFVDFNYIGGPGSGGLVNFSERRFNEGENANGLSSIQSETKQLACDGYCGVEWGGINCSDRVGKCGSRQRLHMFVSFPVSG